jgi:hypothetical protein
MCKYVQDGKESIIINLGCMDRGTTLEDTEWIYAHLNPCNMQQLSDLIVNSYILHTKVM